MHKLVCVCVVCVYAHWTDHKNVNKFSVEVVNVHPSLPLLTHCSWTLQGERDLGDCLHGSERSSVCQWWHPLLHRLYTGNSCDPSGRHEPALPLAPRGQRDGSTRCLAWLCWELVRVTVSASRSLSLSSEVRLCFTGGLCFEELRWSNGLQAVWRALSRWWMMEQKTTPFSEKSRAHTYGRNMQSRHIYRFLWLCWGWPCWGRDSDFLMNLSRGFYRTPVYESERRMSVGVDDGRCR